MHVCEGQKVSPRLKSSYLAENQLIDFTVAIAVFRLYVNIFSNANPKFK